MRQTQVAHRGAHGVRSFTARQCEAHQGHEHNYDHITRVVRGRIRVSFDDGREPVELGMDETVLVKARVRHTVKALETDTAWDCVFNHRDFNGEIVESYVGNPEAYGHDRLIEPAEPLRHSLLSR